MVIAAKCFAERDILKSVTFFKEAIVLEVKAVDIKLRCVMGVKKIQQKI